MDGDNSDKRFLSGYVSLTGRPNVGKSTLMNLILGQKVSIVTSKPQTTRNRVLGIRNLPGAQVIFLDTPGIHRARHGLGEHMNREARQAIRDVDVVLYMVEPSPPSKQDMEVVKGFTGLDKPIVLLINKCDSIRRDELLPIMKAYSALYPFESIIPASALTGEGVEDLMGHIVGLMPEGPMYYPEEMLTDSVERFLVAEMVREKVMLMTDEEVPHCSAVEVLEWKEQEGLVHIRADILVEKPGQKGIIIGKKGARLKGIGSAARADIEALLCTRVFLELFVRVEEDWRRRKSVLRDLGFEG